MKEMLRIPVLCAALLIVISAGTSLAQTEGEPQGEMVSTSSDAPDRSGFTLLLTLGVGVQDNDINDKQTVGLGGLNLGIGGFVNPDLAVMFRISGTNVHPESTPRTVSGVGAVSLQYWPSDSFNLEGGAGVAFAREGDRGDFGTTTETGFGIMLGGGWSFYHRNKHSFQLGLEYAPAFLDAGTVHNVSFNFGWQFL